MAILFQPLDLRGAHARNRIMVSPMCQYSAEAGRPNDWHLVHLGGLARGGAGLVMSEATAVVPEGRISRHDTGIWSEDLAESWRPIVDFTHGQGALAAVQLAHAGHKASTHRPWDGRGPLAPTDGGWTPVGPSAVGYPGLAVPRRLEAAELPGVATAFADAARRADAAGFDVVEVHAAHGYLLHSFLSPLTNDRADDYGGDLAGRARLLLDVVRAVRAAWPADKALLVRISATDWVDGGHSIDDSLVLAGWLRQAGVDLVDVSSGGASPRQRVRPSPGYQVPLAERIRREVGIPTAAVGLISQPRQAEEVLASGAADLVTLGRALLRDPQWPLRAAHELGVDVPWPPQLARGHW